MNPRSRKIAVFVSGAALAGGAAVGVAAGGDSAASSTSTPSSMRGGPGGPGGGFGLASVAEELGVTEARLRKAMDAARPTGSARPDPDAMAEAIADELGIPADKVSAALADAMPQGGPPSGGGGAPPPDDSAAPPADTSAS